MKKENLGNLGAWAALMVLMLGMPSLGNAAATPKHQAAQIVGDWKGAIDTGGGSLRVVIHVTQDKNGKLSATMDSPDQHATGIVIASIAYKKPALHFAIEQFGAGYDGILSEDNAEIVGQWKQGSASLPLTFVRAGK
jgi:hypothetical protein